MKNFLFLLSILIVASCDVSVGNRPQNIPKRTSNNYQLGYNLTRPDTIIRLSNKLVEISGLTVANETQLYAVNDEQAIVFAINKANGEIESFSDFGKDGDFEGIEMINDKIYVLKNNGTVYAVELNEGIQTEKYSTELKPSNDVEGLGYDPVTHQLLLACKGKAGDGAAFKDMRAVYGFDLSMNSLLDQPRLLITEKDTKAFVQTYYGDKAALLKRIKSFAPSAITVHPKTGDWWILSTVGKTLIVVSPQGKIQTIEFLNKKIFPQPEGICFEADGTLFISSEGAGAKARLIRFESR